MFKIGQRVELEGLNLPKIGKVGMSGIITDILGNPVGRLGMLGMIFDEDGNVLGRAPKYHSEDVLKIPDYPKGIPDRSSTMAKPQRFETIEERKIDDMTRALKDIEGGYDWFTK